MRDRAGIILAGGAGKRFQSRREAWQDKVLSQLDGRPLLVHAVESVLRLVDEVVVCVNDDERKMRYAQVLKAYGLPQVALAVDEKFDHLGGPLVAIYSGLKAVKAELCFTLPSDMPLVQPKVIQYMFGEAKSASVVVPIWPSSRLETLMMCIQRANCIEITETLCRLNRPRTDDLIRGASVVSFAAVTGNLKALDPDLKSFVNVNFPEDLTLLQPHNSENGTITRDLHVDRGILPFERLRRMREAEKIAKSNQLFKAAELFSKAAFMFGQDCMPFWTALAWENAGKAWFSANEPAKARTAFLEAAAAYQAEAKLHANQRLGFLAERAQSDMEWVQSRAANL